MVILAKMILRIMVWRNGAQCSYIVVVTWNMVASVIRMVYHKDNHMVNLMVFTNNT